MAGIYISTTDTSAPTGRPIFTNGPAQSPSSVPGAQLISSFDISASNPSVSGAITGAGASAGKPQFGNLTVTRSIDLASPILLRYLATGTVLKDLKISVVSGSGGSAAQVTLGYFFTNARVTGLQHTGDSGSLSEVLMFSYSTIEMDYTSLNMSEGRGITTQVKWDVQRNASF